MWARKVALHYSTDSGQASHVSFVMKIRRHGRRDAPSPCRGAGGRRWGSAPLPLSRRERAGGEGQIAAHLEDHLTSAQVLFGPGGGRRELSAGEYAEQRLQR